MEVLKLNEQDFLGEIVVKHNKSLTLNLRGMSGHRSVKNKGTITVHAEETVASRKAIEMIFRCSHLENRDLFSKSDPFLRISKIVESGGSIPICKTEVAMNNLNPTWKPVCLTMQQFGSESTSEISSRIGNTSQGKNWSKFSDSIFFLEGPYEASNGNPLLPQSLHYIDPSGQLNSYQQVIFEVGEVVQFYDSDKHFPAWGLGGRTMDSAVSHCFSLNGSASDPEVEGVNGIMAARSSALRNVALAGPTLFGQVINKAAQIASQLISYNQSKYFILLILTDGVLSDLQETVNVLVKASDLALSILIIGVGGADFKEMEFLDADNRKRLESSTGRIGTRDILQFVPMREVHGGQISIVQSLLEELPSQFLTYMRSSDVNPHFVNEAQTSATENLPKSF